MEELAGKEPIEFHTKSKKKGVTLMLHNSKSTHARAAKITHK